VVVVHVGVADGDLTDVPLHATGLVLATGVPGVVTGQLGPVHGGRVPVQAVEEHPGGCVAPDAELVVVVVMAAEDLHVVGGHQAGPVVAQGRDVADHPAAGRRVGMDGAGLAAGGVLLHGDRIESHVCGSSGDEPPLEAVSAAEHRA